MQQALGRGRAAVRGRAPGAQDILGFLVGFPHTLPVCWCSRRSGAGRLLALCRVTYASHRLSDIRLICNCHSDLILKELGKENP